MFLTAAGLDSACVGGRRPRSSARFRAAQERALELGLCGPSLGLVFEEALKIAARVRGETKLGEGRVSLAEIAVQLLRERIAATPGRVALVGVSPMTERAALALAQAGLDFTVVNRTAEKAAALAARFGATHGSLDEFRRSPPQIEALLTSTGAGHAILDGSRARAARRAFEVGEPPADRRHGRSARTSTRPRASEARDSARSAWMRSRGTPTRAVRRACCRLPPRASRSTMRSTSLQDRFTERYYGPLFGALQQRFRHTAQEGVKRLLKKELKGLGEAERAAIEVWSEVLAAPVRAHPRAWGRAASCTDGPDGSINTF